MIILFFIYIIAFFVSMWLIVSLSSCFEEKIFKKFYPEIYEERDRLKNSISIYKESNRKLKETNEQLKKKLNLFTYTNPKTDHNIYIKQNQNNDK